VRATRCAVLTSPGVSTAVARRSTIISLARSAWVVLASSLALAAGSALACAGCEARVSIGVRCGASSECPLELRCVAGRCRAGCSAGADCEAPFACVIDASGVGACGVAEDRTCEGGCVEPLICSGGACVQPCDEVRQCAAGLGCVEGQCARVETEPCDLLTGTGCETGRRCELGADATPSCRAVTIASDQMVSLHAPCSETSECAAGLSCAGGRCLRPCLRDGEDVLTSCGPGRRCAQYDEAGEPAPSDTIGYCTEPCDPVAQVGCAVSEHTCAIVYDPTTNVGSCRFAPAVCVGGLGARGCALGEPAPGCGAGLAASHYLMGTGASGPIGERCFALCDTDADCDDGFRCHLGSGAFDIETLDGTVRRIGACLPACEGGTCEALAADLGLACEPSGRFCTSACEAASDCYPGFACTTGRCTPP
jgi:hypothetical protein